MKSWQPADRGPFRHRSVAPRFRDAFLGFYQAYREEPNLRFHIFAASGVLVAGVAVGLQPWETAYLMLTVASVLLAEMVNTAIERTVDLACSGRRHPLAAQAKEIAAGAVLLTALHALFAAAYVFVVQHGLATTLGALAEMVRNRAWLLALPVATGALGLLAGKTEHT